MNTPVAPAGVMVVGTDTDVGKTIVAGGLARMLRKRGERVAVYKPFLSGDATAMDAQILARAAGMAGPGLLQPALLDVISPFRFAAPLAPGIAARREKREVSLEDAVEHARDLGRVCDVMVVEGAGGLLVPLSHQLTPDATVLDLVEKLGLPALLVGRTALGTINHTALSILALRARRIPVAGIILNQTDPAHDLPDQDHLEAIQNLTGLPVLIALPFVGGSEAILVGSVARALETNKIWERITAATAARA